MHQLQPSHSAGTTDIGRQTSCPSLGPQLGTALLLLKSNLDKAPLITRFYLIPQKCHLLFGSPKIRPSGLALAIQTQIRQKTRVWGSGLSFEWLQGAAGERQFPPVPVSSWGSLQSSMGCSGVNPPKEGQQGTRQQRRVPREPQPCSAGPNSPLPALGLLWSRRGSRPGGHNAVEGRRNSFVLPKASQLIKFLFPRSSTFPTPNAPGSHGRAPVPSTGFALPFHANREAENEIKVK